MSVNNAELSVILREMIDPEIADTINRTATLKNFLESTGKGDIGGRGAHLYAKVEENPDLFWFAEGGIYPEGDKSARVKMTVNYSRFAISSRLTMDAIEGKDKKALVDILSDQMKDDADTGMQEISEQFYGDGSGTKAIVKSVASNDVTFRADASDTTPDVANFGNSYGGYLVRTRGDYDFISGDGATDRSTGTVAVGSQVGSTQKATTYVDGDTWTFDGVPSNPGLLDGDMLVPKGSYGIAVNGLDGIINSGTGTFQGVSRNTYPALRSITLDASNGELTVAMLYKVTSQAKYLRGKSIFNENFVMISSPTQVNKYLLLADVSTSGYDGTGANSNLTDMPAGKKLDYGFNTYSFNGLEWIEDERCPDHKIFLIRKAGFRVYEMKPFNTVPLSGDNALAPVPAFTSAGVGAYSDNRVYTFTWKGALGSKDPQNSGLKIDNLAIGSGVAKATNGFSLT